MAVKLLIALLALASSRKGYACMQLYSRKLEDILKSLSEEHENLLTILCTVSTKSSPSNSPPLLARPFFHIIALLMSLSSHNSVPYNKEKSNNKCEII